MASSFPPITMGMPTGIGGVVRITVAVETLMHQDRGAWPIALRRLVD